MSTLSQMREYLFRVQEERAEKAENLRRGRWKTRDGRVMYIYQMETTHIENCIKLLERRINECKPKILQEAVRVYIEESRAFIRLFEHELVKRGVITLSTETTPEPEQNSSDEERCLIL